MDGSLALHQGVLYVGRHAKTARVRSFDLDGHPLETRIDFRDEERGRSSAAGIAVDADHRIWVADEAGEALRSFTLFGTQVACVRGEPEDVRGALGAPVDVLALGEDDALTLVVATGGARRHALQELHPESGLLRSLRPLGDPEGRFADLVDLAAVEDQLLACERRAARVQVFRGGDFHYALGLPAAAPEGCWPAAVAPVGDGRVVLAVAGSASAVLLLDAAGRLLRVLAEEGDEEGRVRDPCDLVLEPAPRDHDVRIAVLDQAAERVQVLTLDGICYGTFPTLRVP